MTQFTIEFAVKAMSTTLSPKYLSIALVIILLIKSITKFLSAKVKRFLIATNYGSGGVKDYLASVVISLYSLAALLNALLNGSRS